MPDPLRPAAAVVARDLVLSHDDHVALAGGSLEVPEGAVAAVVGPNGSGKSSLLDAVAGLLPVRGGSLGVLGAEPGRRGAVAYVLQATEVPEHLPMTVREVVTMGCYPSLGLLRPLGREGRDRVVAAMERTGVADLADRQLLELSGGQRQRVLVAQGLVTGAPLLLLDEPMTGLDVVSRAGIERVVGEEQAAGRTVVYTTHDLAEAATADVVVLLAGRVVAAGSPSEVLTEEHLSEAYRGRLVTTGGLAVLDDPHHHGSRRDRHDGHAH